MRYRDNFLVLFALSEAEDKNVHLDGMFDAFRLLTGMEVILEQVADEIGFVECTLGNPLGDCPISVRDLLSRESKSTPAQVRKKLSPMAPIAKPALTSIIPDDVKQANICVSQIQECTETYRHTRRCTQKWVRQSLVGTQFQEMCTQVGPAHT